MAIRSQVILVASLLSVAGSAFAQNAMTTTVPDHPRVNQVDQRLTNQENRTANGVNSGTITAKQEERDNARDAHISNEVSADEAKHDGHLTEGEQSHINNQLNRNSNDIARQKAVPGAGTAAK